MRAARVALIDVAAPDDLSSRHAITTELLLFVILLTEVNYVIWVSVMSIVAFRS
jgi:hypothetical protein